IAMIVSSRQKFMYSRPLPHISSIILYTTFADLANASGRRRVKLRERISRAARETVRDLPLCNYYIM
ncbi:MAG: hypothetical protein MR914_05795, partial [Clostridiales bacterium]|nr:hypothetical protein [Clostridiales bacterium]